MGGTFEKPDADIRIDLADLPARLGPETVFVSHSPALGILDPGFGDVHIGSSAPCVSSWTRIRVRAHIHGHSHAGFGRQGNHFNVASAARMRSMIIDLEKTEVSQRRPSRATVSADRRAESHHHARRG